MNTNAVNKVIDDFENLSLEDKEYITEILQKNLVEQKRAYLEERIKEAEENFRTGSARIGSVHELIEELRADGPDLGQ
jgi:fibrillarin-like rRNA methylase